LEGICGWVLSLSHPSSHHEAQGTWVSWAPKGNKSVEEYTYQFIELTHYAPEEVNKDEKKQDMFRKGLNAEHKRLLSPCISPDFNTLMNMAIITERAMAEEKRDNKRNFLETKAR
jgi:hypothetical protein